MSDSDEVEHLRRRARRRLIGAAAVVLFLVIVPPMLMDLEPRPVSSNLSVEIPALSAQKGGDAGAVVTRPVAASPGRAIEAPAPEGTSPTPGSSADRSSSLAAGTDLTTGVAAAAGATAGAAAGEVATARSNIAAAPAAVPAPPPLATAGSAGMPAADSSKTEATRPGSSASASAAKAAKPSAARPDEVKGGDAAAAETRVEGWVVPLGTFSARDNAVQLQHRAEQLGMKAFYEKVVTAAGERIRVRAGPFATREQAERARTRLREAGVDALAARKIEKQG